VKVFGCQKLRCGEKAGSCLAAVLRAAVLLCCEKRERRCGAKLGAAEKAGAAGTAVAAVGGRHFGAAVLRTD
jgi:hypothetical protein